MAGKTTTKTTTTTQDKPAVTESTAKGDVTVDAPKARTVEDQERDLRALQKAIRGQ